MLICCFTYKYVDEILFNKIEILNHQTLIVLSVLKSCVGRTLICSTSSMLVLVLLLAGP